MVSQELLTVEGLQTSNVESSEIVNNYGIYVHTGPPVFAYLSNNIVYPCDRASLPFLDVPQAQYDGVPLSVVTGVDRFRRHNPFLDTESFHLVRHTLPL
jgi:hypothetical protein